MYPKNSTELLLWLKKKNLFAKKAFSQNFLIDFNILKKIVNISLIDSKDIILEIGPGPGVLTNKLLETNAHVISVEKDHRFANELSKLFSNFKNFEIIENDILKVFEDIFKNNKFIKVVANIPYNITSSILEKLCRHSTQVQSATLLVQKEFGERIVAKKGKISGSISRFVQFHFDPEIIQIVSSKCFFPEPKVDSCILLLKPRVTPKVNEDMFFPLVRSSFYNRRKKLISALKKTHAIEKLKMIFQKMDLSENARAEELSLDNFLQLFKELN